MILTDQGKDALCAEVMSRHPAMPFSALMQTFERAEDVASNIGFVGGDPLDLPLATGEAVALSEVWFHPLPTCSNGLACLNDILADEDWRAVLDEQIIELLANSPESQVAIDCTRVVLQAENLVRLCPDVELPDLLEVRVAVARQCAAFLFG